MTNGWVDFIHADCQTVFAPIPCVVALVNLGVKRGSLVLEDHGIPLNPPDLGQTSFELRYVPQILKRTLLC